jgi:hypothetical protein
MLLLMLAVLEEMNFLVFSFRSPVNNHAANSAPEAKPSPIANVLDLLILLNNLIFCGFVAVRREKYFSSRNFETQKHGSLGHDLPQEKSSHLGYGTLSSGIQKHQQPRTHIECALRRPVDPA